MIRQFQANYWPNLSTDRTIPVKRWRRVIARFFGKSPGGRADLGSKLDLAILEGLVLIGFRVRESFARSVFGDFVVCSHLLCEAV